MKRKENKYLINFYECDTLIKVGIIGGWIAFISFAMGFAGWILLRLIH
jgi:hypothetical protein